MESGHLWWMRLEWLVAQMLYFSMMFKKNFNKCITFGIIKNSKEIHFRKKKDEMSRTCYIQKWSPAVSVEVSFSASCLNLLGMSSQDSVQGSIYKKRP